MQSNTNWHSIRTYAILVVIALVAVLQALHGATAYTSVTDLLATVLLGVEHQLMGNSLGSGPSDQAQG